MIAVGCSFILILLIGTIFRMMKVRNQYNFISKSKLLWPTWSDQVSKLWKVIFVFYCIYTDVKRSIRKGNNPKVFCWSGMSGPDRKSVPVLFNNAGLTKILQGKKYRSFAAICTPQSMRHGRSHRASISCVSALPSAISRNSSRRGSDRASTSSKKHPQTSQSLKLH